MNLREYVRIDSIELNKVSFFNIIFYTSLGGQVFGAPKYYEKQTNRCSIGSLDIQKLEIKVCIVLNTSLLVS